MIKEKIEDLVPIVFGTIVQNKSHPNGHTNQARNKNVKILLDSGASASIIQHSYLRKNDFTQDKTIHEWTTMAGTFKTTRTAKIELKLPELNSTATIAVKCHVTKEKSNYDLIIGRDVLRELGITLDFSNNTTNWQDVTIPMKPINCDIKTHFTIRDSTRVQSEIQRIKKILDANYQKANLPKIVKDLIYLNSIKQKKLLKLLRKYEKMFDGTLGNYTGSTYKIELKEKVAPYHAKPFPIPKVLETTLKKEVERLVKIGVLKKINNSEWAAPTFIIPKKNGTVRFISDFRELNNVYVENHSQFQKYKTYC